MTLSFLLLLLLLLSCFADLSVSSSTCFGEPDDDEVGRRGDISGSAADGGSWR